MKLPEYFRDRARDFVALRYPNFYEKIYNRHTKTQMLDCGEFLKIRRKNRTDFFCVKKEFDFSLALPLNFDFELAEKKIAAVIHIFYPELAEEIKKLLLNIPCKVDIYISTVSEEKKYALEKIFSDFDKGKVIVKVFDNRGRDIAPAFIGFKNIYRNYDLCLHLHSKKSPHASNRLFGWRDYLYDNLLGSEKIIRGIFKIMENEKIGVVFPQYFTHIRLSRHWGENYLITKNLLNRLNIEITNENLIEFPSGSMFWFKPAALAPLLESDINFEDFPPELGQIDGTFAHGIERAFLYIAESAGFSWIKTCTKKKDAANTPVLESSTQEELDDNIKKIRRSVLKTVCEKNFPD